MSDTHAQFGSFVHILPGDALAGSIPEAWGGRRIIFREALVDGPLSPVPDPAFWTLRARHIARRYGDTEEGYWQKVVYELDQLQNLSPETGVCLWFEDDLFCQLNLWCVVTLLCAVPHGTVYRVFPAQASPDWTGFGRSTPQELAGCLARREEIPAESLRHIQALWRAAASEQEDTLRALGRRDNAGLRGLSQIIECRIRLQHVREPGNSLGSALRQIAGDHPDSLREACAAFWKSHPQYGLGDLQLINLWKDLGYSWRETTG